MKNFKFTTKCSCIICKQETTTQSFKAHLQKHLKPIIEKQCPKCGTTHSKSGIFCSRKCANARIPSIESNEKRSKTLKNRENAKIKSPPFTKVSYCIICNKLFIGHKRTCSPSCKSKALSIAGRKAGKIAASKNIKRSKDEIALYELCASYFEKVEHNLPLFNGWDADILIHDTKTAILWNGPWHYREMGLKNHSLLQVQNRDKIKCQEIIKAGWTPIIFEDRHYTPQTAFQTLL